MPLYEYACYDCTTRFEALRPMSKADEPIQCKECESMHTVRALSRIAVHCQNEGTGDSAIQKAIKAKGVRPAGGCCGSGGCGGCGK